jgi:DNA repair protein RadA/Sms
MYHCSHCDAQYLKWQGRCTQCEKWGTFVENDGGKSTKGSKGTKATTSAPAEMVRLNDKSKKPATSTPTNIVELDRVLSGGLVAGSVTLLAGEPGIGKSTLVAQLAANMATGSPSFYISGEESDGQVLMRFERLAIDPKDILFSNSVDVGAIISSAQKDKPSLLIVDSIQTMIAQGADSLPGTITAVRAATSELVGFAKSSHIPVLIIGQITKDGSIAGPKTLEHLVDTLLLLEGDKQGMYRLLRAAKHRFGSTDEIGIFEMLASGLESVKNPSARFLEERREAPGSAVTCLIEGSRPMLVEIQALVETSHYSQPIRRTSGFDAGRLQMLLAILGKRAKAKFSDKDVYINVIGGLKIKEHAADLAVCAALLSSLRDKALSAKAVHIGELGLGGEVRSVPFVKKRKKEAERLGLSAFVTPEEIDSVKDL